MKRAELIVCERRDRFTPALRNALVRLGVMPAELAGRRSWLRQRQGVAACYRLLEERPSSLIVLEISIANIAEVLELMAVLPNRWPQARCVAVLDEATAPFRAGFRAAGVIHIVQSVLQADQVAELTLAHFARLPVPVQTWREELWESLPWQE